MSIQKDEKKKAILVVSFGTSYLDALAKNITQVEESIRAAFPEFEVRRAFTSRFIIKKIFEKNGIRVENEQEALERLQQEGFTEVYVQPLHIIAGEEYAKVRTKIVHYQHRKIFDKIAIGRPLLYYMGQENKPDDYLIAIHALKDSLPQCKKNEAVLFMGHGGLHPSNAAYALLQMKLEEAGAINQYVYTVEGFPHLGFVISKLKERQIEKVTLIPFMLVAGDHAVNDMVGEDEDSAKMQLIKQGFQVEWKLVGLGECEKIQEIYVGHLKDAIIGR